MSYCILIEFEGHLNLFQFWQAQTATESVQKNPVIFILCDPDHFRNRVKLVAANDLKLVNESSSVYCCVLVLQRYAITRSGLALILQRAYHLGIAKGPKPDLSVILHLSVQIMFLETEGERPEGGL